MGEVGCSPMCVSPFDEVQLHQMMFAALVGSTDDLVNHALYVGIVRECNIFYKKKTRRGVYYTLCVLIL